MSKEIKYIILAVILTIMAIFNCKSVYCENIQGDPFFQHCIKVFGKYSEGDRLITTLIQKDVLIFRSKDELMAKLNHPDEKVIDIYFYDEINKKKFHGNNWFYPKANDTYAHYIWLDMSIGYDKAAILLSHELMHVIQNLERGSMENYRNKGIKEYNKERNIRETEARLVACKVGDQAGISSTLIRCKIWARIEGRIEYSFLDDLFEKDDLVEVGWAEVSDGPFISKKPVILDEKFKIVFELKEIRGIAKQFEKIAVAILKEDNTFVYDAKIFKNVNLSPRKKWRKTVKTKIYKKHGPGKYKVVVRGKLQNDDWFDFGNVESGKNHVVFKVIQKLSTRLPQWPLDEGTTWVYKSTSELGVSHYRNLNKKPFDFNGYKVTPNCYFPCSGSNLADCGFSPDQGMHYMNCRYLGEDESGVFQLGIGDPTGKRITHVEDEKKYIFNGPFGKKLPLYGLPCRGKKCDGYLILKKMDEPIEFRNVIYNNCIIRELFISYVMDMPNRYVEDTHYIWSCPGIGDVKHVAISNAKYDHHEKMVTTKSTKELVDFVK